MSRIYLDSNVFSNLKNNQEEKYRNLMQSILKYKNSLTFFFSHAHIRDKKKDTTEHKFSDFEFMETIIKDNYLSYHALDKITSHYLAVPSEVFEDEEPGDGYDFLDNYLDENQDDDNTTSSMKSMLKSVLSMHEVNLNIPENINEDDKGTELLKKFMPEKDGKVSLLDLIKHQGSFLREMSGSSLYKDFRKYLEEKKANIPFKTGEDTYTLDELFKNNEVGDVFIAYVKDTLHHKDKDNIPFYDFYLQAYYILDMFGFSKDKLSKKNSFNNLFNDGLHSYYARYCDILVTDDDGLRKKSEILYRMLGNNTQILNVSEFLERIDTIGARTELNATDFFQKLADDLISQPVQSKEEYDNDILYNINLSSSYFNFFDKLIVVNTKDDDVYVFINKNETKHLSNPNFRESEMITNLMIDTLGQDVGKKLRFDFKNEIDEMKKDKWNGRYWEYGDTSIHLQINDGTKELCIKLGPFKKWLFISHFKRSFRTDITKETQ